MQSTQKRARQQLSCTACRHGKLCPGAPLFGFSGTLPAIFGGCAVVSPTPSALMTYSRSGAFFSLKMPSSSHHVPASLPSSLSPSSPKPGPSSTRQLQPPRSIFQGIMQPALLDLLPMHQITMPHLDAIDSLGITPRSIPTPLGLPLFRLFSLYLWAAQYLAKSWDLSEIIES